MRSRLQQLLGRASPWVLQPQRSALACGVAWLLTLPLTWPHLWLALLGLSAIWGLTVVLLLEKPLLQALPLPPLTVLFIGLSLRWGLGPFLLALSGSGGDKFIDIWIQYGPPAQLLWLCFSAALLISSLFQSKSISIAASHQPESTWLGEAVHSPGFRSKLKFLISILSTYMLAYISLSVLSGAFDRQFDSVLINSRQVWRLNLPVVAFSRLRDIWFLLFPLSIRISSRFIRIVLLIELTAFFACAMLSGSRGLIFYPAVLMFLGLWFVIADPNVLKRLGVLLVLVIFLLSPLIYVVRDSSSFQKAQSFEDRINAVGVALTHPGPLLQKARWFGRDLYACHDPYLFTPQNRDLPRAGSSGLGALMYLWLPKHLNLNRPTLFDGHIIAKSLQRVKTSTWTSVWFPCFSLPADLLRRWSIAGLFFGSLLVAAFLQLLFHLWYRTATTSGNTFQLLLLLFPATYLQSFPFGTVSETAWALLWELPKYLILFWLLGVMGDRYIARKDA